MSVEYQKKKLNPFGAITLLRMFLWWGTEIARHVLIYQNPKARIIHMFRSESIFSVSKWIFTNEKTYCLVSDKTKGGVDIYSFGQVNPN